MIFSAPIFLWSAFGALVPIAIHLWSKRDTRIIKFGSIRFLDTDESVKSSNFRLNEIVLLALRVTLIVAIALVLAQPKIEAINDDTADNLAVLIAPGLAGNMEQFLNTDKLQNASYKGVLKAGLPQWEEGVNYIDEQTSGWNLIDQIEQLDQDSVVIIAHNHLSLLEGRRPITSKYIVWVGPPENRENELIVKASYTNQDEFKVWKAITSADQTEINTQVLKNEGNDLLDFKRENGLDSVKLKGQPFWVPIKENDQYNVLLYSADEFKQDEIYLVAALEAIGDFLNINMNVASVTEFTPEVTGAQVVIDLGSQIKVSQPSLHLTFQEDLFGELIQEGDMPNELCLTQRLNAQNIIDSHLTSLLMAIIQPNLQAKDLLRSYDQRVISDKLVSPIHSNRENTTTIKQLDLSAYIWGVILLLLVSERTLALIRKR